MVEAEPTGYVKGDVPEPIAPRLFDLVPESWRGREWRFAPVSKAFREPLICTCGASISLDACTCRESLEGPDGRALTGESWRVWVGGCDACEVVYWQIPGVESSS